MILLVKIITNSGGVKGDTAIQINMSLRRAARIRRPVAIQKIRADFEKSARKLFFFSKM